MMATYVCRRYSDMLAWERRGGQGGQGSHARVCQGGRLANISCCACTEGIPICTFGCTELHSGGDRRPLVFSSDIYISVVFLLLFPLNPLRRGCESNVFVFLIHDFVNIVA